VTYPSRGAWRFRNQTRGFDFWPTLDSVLISEAHPEDLATFSCSVVDRAASLVFEPEDKVWVTFAGTRIFAGHLKAVEESQLSEVGPRVYGLDAQDYTAKLDDSVIDHPAERAAESVAARVAWILGFLNYTITTDHVDPPSMTLDAATYDGMTVREALDQVADEARCHWYVDFDADLHLARDEVVSAPFALDDTDPNYSTSFPYTEYRRSRDTTDLATAVYIQGESDQSWVTDSGAIATWGRQERSVNDGDLKTSNQRTRAGDRALAEQAAPIVDGSLVCWEPGLRGGMKATLRNDLWSLDTTIVLVSVEITAVDPHDADGEAYLRSEVRFRDRRRRRSSHRDVTNRNSRKRKGTSGDADAAVADGDALDIWPVMEGRLGWLWPSGSSNDGWSGPGIVGAPKVGSWVAQNTGWPSTDCGIGPGLWGPGGWTCEAWYPVTVPDGIAGATFTFPDFSASSQGVALGAAYIVGWALDVTPGGLGGWVEVGRITDAGGSVFVPGSLMVPSPGADATGAGNWLVLAPGWEAHRGWTGCGNDLVGPYNGPVLGGEAASGNTVPPSHGSVTATALVNTGPGRTSWVGIAGGGVADGTNDTFELADWSGEGVPEARWGAVILSAATDYTVDASAKTVTFREPPPEGTVVAFRYRTD
jgi:hypothetical protein